MSVYIIALLKFTDVEVFAKFNGTAVITDEVPRRLEGNWAVDKVVVLASHLKRTPWRFRNLQNTRRSPRPKSRGQRHSLHRAGA